MIFNAGDYNSNRDSFEDTYTTVCECFITALKCSLTVADCHDTFYDRTGFSLAFGKPSKFVKYIFVL